MSDFSVHIGAQGESAPEVEPKVVQKATYQKSLMEKVNDFLTSLTTIRIRDKVQFFRLLSVLINSGIAITKALRILVDQTENLHMKKIIQGLVESIEAGNSFSEAVSGYPDIFTTAQIGMIESGEASGRLNEILLQIAEEAEKNAAITSKIRGAMIYPIVVIVLMLSAAYGVMVFVMPRIKEMFESLGGELPAMTTTLINVSDFMVNETLGLKNALWVLIVIAAVIAGIQAWKKTPVGRFFWDRAFLYLPVFGKLAKKVALTRFARTLSTLTGSGIGIIKALRITADSVGNTVYAKRIHQIADDVKQGITMAENMKDDEKHFPSMVVGMIAVGEQTAQLDAVSAKLADFYEEQVDDTIKNLSTLLEPLIIVLLGLGVGFLVLAVMLPILQSSDLAFGGV